MNTCPHCGEPLEHGVVVPHVGVEGTVEPWRWHWECWMRQLVGGLNHLRGTCTCCGGTDPPDPPGMTRREAARAAAAEWQNRLDARGCRLPDRQPDG